VAAHSKQQALQYEQQDEDSDGVMMTSQHGDCEGVACGEDWVELPEYSYVHTA